MGLFFAVLPATLVVAGVVAVVAWAVRAPRTAARASRSPDVILRVLEVYCLIVGVGIFGLSVAGVARGGAGSAIGVALGVILLACWFIAMRARRNRERR